MFKVEPCDTSLHYQRLLLDDYDNPIALIRKKNITVHGRWNVFLGDRKRKSNKIYTTQTPNIIQSKSVHVFLANRASNKDGCDFKIKGSWANRNCTIYMGDTTTKLAKMSKMQSGSNNFMVTIYPNADYAFVVTLIAIVEAMENKDEVHVAEGTQATGGTSSLGLATVSGLVSGLDFKWSKVPDTRKVKKAFIKENKGAMRQVVTREIPNDVNQRIKATCNTPISGN
ncbi:hypothetical protein LXL04_019361 [Taraxacum kok-saghyz]